MGTLTGTSGNDRLYVYYVCDLRGGAGADIVIAASGRSEAISGGPGNDILFTGGSQGEDEVSPGRGPVYGSQFANDGGQDLVNGGAGDDLVVCNPFNDFLIGGLYTGDQGIDTFAANGLREDFAITVRNGIVFLSRTGEIGRPILEMTTMPSARLVGFEYIRFWDQLYPLESVSAVRSTATSSAQNGTARTYDLTGTPFDDRITGDERDNSVFGDAGNDRVLGGAGADYIDAGNGNDTIDAGDGDDIVFGRDGRDVVLAGNGDNFVRLGPDGGDVVTGDGDDRVISGYRSSSIRTGSGDDFIIGGYSGDVIDAGPGNNIIKGGYSPSTIIAGSGDDIIFGSAEGDTIAAGSGDDTIVGGQQGVSVDAGPGNDFIAVSFYGPAIVVGGDGNDSASFMGQLSNYNPMRRLNGWVVLSSPQDPRCIFRLTGIETIQFVDQTIRLANPPPVRNRRPVVQADRWLTVPAGADLADLNVPRPTDPEGSPLTVTVLSVPRSGVIFDWTGNAVVTANSTLTVAQLTSLSYLSANGAAGEVGRFRYQVADRQGETAQQTIRIQVASRPASPPQPSSQARPQARRPTASAPSLNPAVLEWPVALEPASTSGASDTFASRPGLIPPPPLAIDNGSG